MAFLSGRPPRPWAVPDGGRANFTAAGYHLGKGNPPLEVAVVTTDRKPNEGDVRNLWKRRRGNTPSPLLLVVIYPTAEGDRASVCGPTGEDPAVYSDRDPGQVERLAAAALDEPDRHAASRLLTSMLPEHGEGLRNVGMFAEHHLRDRVPQRQDWPALTASAQTLLGLRGQELVKALGFTIEARGAANVLRSDRQAAALAVFLDENEAPDAAAARFNGVTPAFWALSRARSENLPFAVLTRRDEIRVYATSENAGVGRKGGTETFVAANLALLPDDQAAYLPLLFGADALVPDGTFDQLLSESQEYSVELGARLRQRVYEQTVPHLAQAIGNRHQEAGGDLDDETLHDLYEQALLILFRLLFVAYAEDRDLLPLHRNGLYRQRSLKHMARELADMLNEHGELRFDPDATDRWDAVRALWNAVDAGNREWGVPKYNGGLFSNDPDVKAAGGALASLSLANEEFGPALAGLLVERDDNGIWGPVDFASLKVREFGTIYEGLLESELSVAQDDLVVSPDGTYVPAGKREAPVVLAGDIYLHNRSGSRKATGSYFTKPFAVSHLLDHALEPALDEHIDRLVALVKAGDDDKAAEAFFDFRVVDLAMGSGHFLVAALDRVEARLSQFLADHPVAGVLDELDRLRAAAEDNLGEQQPAEGIDTSSLLRRQVARRCIYGADINDIAVELARLALWVHTFVEGLPLTSLNHGLVHGNSLTGIGTVDEALDVLEPGRRSGVHSLFDLAIQDAIAAAQAALSRFAQTSEANLKEIRQARKAHADALAATEPVARLFDLAVAVRLGKVQLPPTTSPEDLINHPSTKKAAEVASGVDALHFPVAFPEVFNRDRPGFDCVVGNPPWEEATVEKLGFWALRYPGLKSLTQADAKKEVARLEAARPDLVGEYERALSDAERVREALVKGPYPGMGTGDPDLYKAFCWRFWHLVREDGVIGVVLPRSALSAAGSQAWRQEVLAKGEFLDTTLLLNNRQWVFPEVHPQYTFALVSLRRGGAAGTVRLRGPFPSLARYDEGRSASPAVIEGAALASWSDAASFPLLPSDEALPVFMKLRSHPRLDASDRWTARPVTELHATNEKKEMVLGVGRRTDLWPVYGGRSFDLWNADTGDYYAWADPKHITTYLHGKRLRQQKLARSAFSAFDAEWAKDPATLPCLRPRVAFRDITNRTNTRTVVTALVPPEVVLANQAPYLLFPSGHERDEAFVLGVLASMPLDWYARRFVETHVNFHILNALPIPRPARDHPIRRRVEIVAGTLAAVDRRYAAWAKAVGVPVGPVSGAHRNDLVAELDAAVALLYGLDLDDLRVVYQTFHEGADYSDHYKQVSDHWQRLTKEAGQ